jgi:signal transduction histidine kinase
MAAIIITEGITMTRYKSAVQKRNAAVLLRKPGRLASQYAPDMQVIDKNGIGMVNISEMMRRMGGVCTTEMTEDNYRITLAFPICE